MSRFFPETKGTFVVQTILDHPAQRLLAEIACDVMIPAVGMKVMNRAVSVESRLNALKSKSLNDATIQDLQLELIRRRRFNAFDGQRVADALLRHRDLWEAVMMDRTAISNPGFLPALGLVKLRDLLYNEWNVDTLYILTPSRENAERIAEVFKMEDCGGMVDVHADSEEVDSALGGAQSGQAVVSIWWD